MDQDMPIFDIKQSVIDRLTAESYTILKQVVEDQVSTTEGFRAYFQSIIAKAEESDNTARSMAAVLVMNAFADELLSPQPDQQQSLQARISHSINKMVNR